MDVGEEPILGERATVLVQIFHSDFAFLPWSIPNSSQLFLSLRLLTSTLAVRRYVLDKLTIFVEICPVFLIRDP
jgi:hypothetical protein